MIRILILMLVFAVSSLVCGAQTADRTFRKLELLPLDAKAPEISKYIDNILKSDDNPVNYLPVLSTLDSLTRELERFEFFKSLPLKKFVDDLHLYSEAIDVLGSPYDGPRISAVCDSITEISFMSSTQLENARIDSITDCLRVYYGVTTNFKELLEDLIEGQKKYVAETNPEKKDEILSELEECISFDFRNQRISRIPYLKAKLELVVKACPRGEDQKLLPNSFDIVFLQSLYDANEKNRTSRIKEKSSTNKSKRKTKSGRN